ncbi:MAG: methylenetetrahydrofolate reductase [Firmicutes bacterium]|nr:methylenetetrahydrofolate reductase [Bacillota bacterium]
MKISQILKNKAAAGEFAISFEIIPPRNGERVEEILRKVESLIGLNPDFISITKGAGGSLRGGTVPIAYLIKQKFGIETMAHLTCIDTPVEELENNLMDHRYLGIENILALRGDPPRDAVETYGKREEFTYHKYARDLVTQIGNMNQGRYLRRKMDVKPSESDKGFRDGEKTDFCIAVAGHPEGHPDCPDHEQALIHLREKVAAGADFIVTQMLFDADLYESFVKKCRDAGIDKPIIPGIRPITKYQNIPHIEEFFNVHIPDEFKESLRNKSGPEARKAGIELTRKLYHSLRDKGAPGIHLYMMNDTKIGFEILNNH